MSPALLTVILLEFVKISMYRKSQFPFNFAISYNGVRNIKKNEIGLTGKVIIG